MYPYAVICISATNMPYMFDNSFDMREKKKRLLYELHDFINIWLTFQRISGFNKEIPYSKDRKR